jgi:hypothetical protein
MIGAICRHRTDANENTLQSIHHGSVAHMDAFYPTGAGFCFTLLGLWWALVQFRPAVWMRDRRQRRAALPRTDHIIVLKDGRVEAAGLLGALMGAEQGDAPAVGWQDRVGAI